jgi:hypothetical protein
MPTPTQLLFERLVPEALEATLGRVLGGRVRRLGPGDTFRISSCGRFSGRIAADLLAYSKNQSVDGAFVLVQEEALRALYLAKGVVIGAESNVLFERLGRVLLRLGRLTADDAQRVVQVEETQNTAAAASMLPADVAVVGLDRRAWEVGTALTFMGPSHFVFIEGTVDLEPLPRLSIAAMDLAIEGVRRYDEWRNAAHQPAAAREEATPVVPAREEPAPVAVAREESSPGSAARPKTGSHDVRTDVDAIMRLLRQ